MSANHDTTSGFISPSIPSFPLPLPSHINSHNNCLPTTVTRPPPPPLLLTATTYLLTVVVVVVVVVVSVLSAGLFIIYIVISLCVKFSQKGVKLW